MVPDKQPGWVLEVGKQLDVKPVNRPSRAALIRRTVFEALVLAGINICFVLLAGLTGQDRFLATDENAEAINSLAQGGVWQLLLLVALVGPLLEEFLFRGVPLFIVRVALPRLIAPTTATFRYGLVVIGIVSALLFALAHAPGGGLSHLPIPQLLLGLWSWGVALSRGIWCSVLLHMVYNLVLSLILLLGN